MHETHEEKVIRTCCGLNCINCGFLAHVKDGVLVKFEPVDFPTPGLRHICTRGLSSIKLAYHPDRLKYPLKRIGKRGEGKWERISWEEAYRTISSKFKEIGEKYGYESLAFPTGGNAPMMSIYLKLAAALQGTWVNVMGFGDTAGPCGDFLSYGVMHGLEYTTHFEDPAMVVIWGANLVETYPLVWRKINRTKERGTRLVVIDPRFTSTASKADDYISIRPGTDVALSLGMMNVIMERGLTDDAFINRYTVGPFLVRKDNGMFLREKDIAPEGSEKYIVWDLQANNPRIYDEAGFIPALTGVYHIHDIECRPAFQLLLELAQQYPLEKASEITGVPQKVIERLAAEHATLKPIAAYRGWGVQRTFHGDLTWRSITTLSAITGNIKPESAREFKLNRGGFISVKGRRFKRMPIMKMYEAVMTGKPYPIKALWIAGTNLLNQIPDNNIVISELVPSLDFIVVADMFMNLSAQYADIVLPVCSSYEHLNLVTPVDPVIPYMQIQQKVIEPLYESKPDFTIVSELGSRMGFEEQFDINEEEGIELLLNSGHPSVKGISLETLKEGPVKLPDYEIPVKVPAFRTPSGRIEFYSEAMIQFEQELPVYKEPLESGRRPLAEQYPLVCLSTHTKYRFHSTLANVSLSRELDPEPLVEMNPVDAEKRSIQDGDNVLVFNDRGNCRLKAKIHNGIRAGVVNINQGWWPEDYAEGTHQALTHAAVNPAQEVSFEPNAALYDVLVEVKKA
ncbi:molybdopterin-dependent oxidoreductase [Thermodesulfobacteriota bacterium]